jgi:hypothetical protein
MRISFLLSAALILSSGCSNMDGLKPKPAAPVPSAPVNEVVLPVATTSLTTGATAAAFDQTTAAEKASALNAAPTSGARALGQVVVSLGNPAEQGFWLRSSLVSVASKGTVKVSGGPSLAVDLLPGQSGAQLSLAAFRALGLTLTDLPEVAVFAQ